MTIDHFLAAAAFALTPLTLLAIVLGALVGLFVGAIPGLSVTMAMALLAPATFSVPPIIGIPFLISLYKAGTFGGSVASILIGTPGTASNAATVIDGYRLAQRGWPGRAIIGALSASVCGDVVGSIALIFGAPLIALIAIKFGSAEFFSLVVFSMTMVCFVSSGSLVRGLLAAALGLVLAVVGLDPIGGSPRLTFGIDGLRGGINIIPLVIGIFALAEVLVQLEAGVTAQSPAVSRGRRDTFRFRELLVRPWLVIRSAVVGTVIGALPGIGAETSSWVSYGLARRASRRPSQFGRGSIEGVIAPEVANNAVCGAAMVPMLVFAIPGDIVTAILMGALIAQGLQPGPRLIEQHSDLFIALFICVMLASIALYFVARVTLPIWRKVLEVPRPLLNAAIVILCVAGTYGVNGSYFDLAVMFVFGIVGYAMRKLRIPVAPLLLAFILSRLLEESLRNGLIQAGGSFVAFVFKPIPIVFLTLAAVVVVTVIVDAFRRPGGNNGASSARSG
jgi:putative tricarboxylic transport membrane protein